MYVPCRRDLVVYLVFSSPGTHRCAHRCAGVGDALYYRVELPVVCCAGASYHMCSPNLRYDTVCAHQNYARVIVFASLSASRFSFHLAPAANETAIV